MDKRKKVLCVTPELQYTGALQSFRRICIVLQNNGYVVDVWSYVEGPYREEFRKIGIDVRIVPEKSIDNDLLGREITQYNLIIANTVCTYGVADLAQGVVPVVWYIREAENLPDFFWKKERKTAMCRAKKLYSVSEYARDFIVANYNDNVKVVHNFVDDVFENEGAYLDLQPDTKIKFLALGTIEKRKGYDVLVDGFLALPEAVRERCELHFAGRLWSGADKFYPALLEKIKPYKNIVYHGELREREKIHALIRECHVVVVPSRDESCSLVALEGAMMARPLILSQNIGAKYILDERCGWIVKTADVAAMTDAYVAAVRAAGSLEQMGRAARENYLKTSTYAIYEKNILAMAEENITDSQIMYRTDTEIELYSFDVFNTLVTRCYGTEKGVFTDIQRQLCTSSEYEKISPYFRQNFVSLRTSAERFMYDRVCTRDKQDVDLEEIYTFLANSHGLGEGDKRRLMRLEIETEKKCLLSIQENIEAVKKLREQNKRVILISDMYFDAQTIREMLCRFDAVFEDIPIYVSCEHLCKKNSGELYKLVQKREKVPYEKWLHIGDSLNGDYEQPSKLGIKTNLYHFSELTPFEKYALTETDDLQTQLSIGTARRVRSTMCLTKKASFGLSLGGPMLFGYVRWVIERALAEGVTRLYFVARDGYVLKRMADEIIRHSGYAIETRYIHGSRIAWRTDDKQQRGLVRRYLEQELDSSGKFAFVEFCGTGVTQDCAASLLSGELADRLYGTFYLYHSRDPEKQASPKYSMLWLSDSFSPLIELLVRAPHGQTIGYEERDGRIVPVLDEAEGAALREYGYEEYIDGAALFVREHIGQLRQHPDSEGDMAPFYLYYAYLTGTDMDRDSVEILGSIPFVLDGEVENVTEYAPRLTPEQAAAIRKDPKAYTGNRMQWSLMRSPEEPDKAPNSSPAPVQAVKKDGELDRAVARYQAAEQELKNIHASATYKIGRVMTYIPRKARGVMRCYKEHGLKYTVNCIIQKIF